MPFDRLGGYTLRRFDGTYDDTGNPMFQEGDSLVETAFRFEAQSAPCIILTEIDFEDVDEWVARRIYVVRQRNLWVDSGRSAGIEWLRNR